MTLTPREKAKQRADAKRPAVAAWKSAALQDGWTAEPIYCIESVDTAAKLQREGFNASIFLRDTLVDVFVWGPDQLAVTPPYPYDWTALQNELAVCKYCQRSGEVVRIGFAGRCCPDCRTEHAAEVEFRGWAD